MLSKVSFVILATCLTILIVDIADGAKDNPEQPEQLIPTGRGGAGNFRKASEVQQSEGNTNPTQQSRDDELHSTGIGVESGISRVFGRGGRGNVVPEEKLSHGEQNKSTSVVAKEAPKIGALAFEQVPEGKITI